MIFQSQEFLRMSQTMSEYYFKIFYRQIEINFLNRINVYIENFKFQKIILLL